MDDLPVVQSLLAEGADVNAKDPEHGETALMLARSEAMRRFLLVQGADVALRDNWGRTAFIATRNPLFLKQGVHINDQDLDGETALMKAVDQADLAQVEWLLTNGADVNARDEAGESALIRARASGLIAIIEILTKAGAAV
jgi:ankyrin repeat protein